MEQEGDKKGHEGWRWTPPSRFPNSKDLHYARAIVMLHEPSGQSLLLESERAGWSQHGWLRPHFEGQKRGSFCALASCAVVLNALRSASPPTSSPPPPTGCSQDADPAKKKRRRSGDGDGNGDDDDHTGNYDGEEATRTEQRRPPERVVTQDDLFSKIVMKHLHKRERDMHKGLHLKQVARLFELAGATVTLRCSEDPLEVSQWLKDDIAAVLSSRTQCVVVNLWREFENHRGGHVSPLAAYHPQRQMVLLLDVASHRTTPHWLSVHDLVPSLCRVDSWSGRARGYLVVTLHPSHQAGLPPA